MKKFLSKIVFATVAVLSVAGFTSCNNTDDDPYVPGPTPGPTEIHTVTPSNNQDMTPAYGAVLSENILDMYDVTVVLHSGDKTKEVALTKANGQADVTRTSNGNMTYYEYVFAEIDGQKGISKAEVKVTPKADIKNVISAMPANEKIIMQHGGNMFKAMFGADGKFVGKLATHFTVLSASPYPEELLKDQGDGTFGYDIIAETIQDCMF